MQKILYAYQKNPNKQTQAYLSCEILSIYKQNYFFLGGGGTGQRHTAVHRKCLPHVMRYGSFRCQLCLSSWCPLAAELPPREEAGCSSQPGYGQKGRTVPPRSARNCSRFEHKESPFEGKGNHLMSFIGLWIRSWDTCHLATEIRHSYSKFTSKSIATVMFAWRLDAHGFAKLKGGKVGPRGGSRVWGDSRSPRGSPHVAGEEGSGATGESRPAHGGCPPRQPVNPRPAPTTSVPPVLPHAIPVRLLARGYGGQRDGYEYPPSP